LSVLTTPIDKVLERAGKNMTDIDIVELIGGGTRIPII
jgi:molecular chaperone DnaK (HSP70)